jgi:hypothetical protein
VGEDTEKIAIVEAADSLDMIENVATVDHTMIIVENVVNETLIPRRVKIMEEEVRVDLNHREGILGKDVDDRGRGDSKCEWIVSYFNSVECALFSGASGHFF